MNESNQTPKTDDSVLDNPQGFDLKAAYEILIQAYVRNHLTLPTNDEEYEEEETS